MIYEYIETKMICSNGRKMTSFKFTKQQETKNICQDCLWKTEQKHGFTTWTARNQNVKVNSTNLTNIKRKNELHIWSRIIKINKDVGWLILPFV